jgi:tetratricopeptide (TPR) repeat protein
MREKTPTNASRITHHASLYYWLALFSFVLCLMSKPMGVTLPFVLLLLDYWPLGRMKNEKFKIKNYWPLLLEKIPFLVLSAVACVLTLGAQELAIVSTAGLPVAQRIAHVLAAYNHYLAAMFVPRNLAVYYPYQIHVPTANIICAAVVLGLITGLAVKNFRRRPYLAVGWLWYLGTLVPVIGLVQVGDQAWADRYTYLPLIGLFIPVVWLAGELVKNRLLLESLGAIVAVALMAATSTQLGYWRDTRTLFEHTASVTPQNALAATILGSLRAQEGKLAEAMEYYQTALRYTPNFPEAHFFLGNALDEQGKLDEAVAEYEKSLWFRPTQEQTHIFMGIALAKQKKYDEAIFHYEAALKLNPDSAVTHNNLARIFHTLGRLDDAIQHYSAALEIDPKLSLAHNNLGILLLQQGNLADGTQHLREALKLKPGNAETKFNLALALNRQEQWTEAAGLFQKIIGVHAADPKAHYEFAVALAHLKRTREALSEYASALLIQPDFPDALDGLAWILATDASPGFRNGPQAVNMSERACELTGRNDPVKLKTLAAAYAETGRFGEATNVLLTAKELATKASRPQLVMECAIMLESFQRSEPWRSP